MIKCKRFFSVLFTGLLIGYMPMTQADSPTPSYSANSQYTSINNADDSRQQVGYGEKIGHKALNGLANLTTGPLEIPKNIINTMNQSNFFYGIAGGFIKGVVNTLGRMGCGIIDIITLPIPTQPIVSPVYIWDNFDVDTTYGEVLRPNKTQKPASPGF